MVDPGDEITSDYEIEEWNYPATGDVVRAAVIDCPLSGTPLWVVDRGRPGADGGGADPSDPS